MGALYHQDPTSSVNDPPCVSLWFRSCPVLDTPKWLEACAARVFLICWSHTISLLVGHIHAVTNPEFAYQMGIYHLFSKNNFEINGFNQRHEGFSCEEGSEALTHLRSSDFHQYKESIFIYHSIRFQHTKKQYFTLSSLCKVKTNLFWWW